MRQFTPSQRGVLATHPILLVQDVPTLALLDSSALLGRVRIILEDGTLTTLRPNYLAQLTNLMHNTSMVDSGWLRCTTEGVYFLATTGVALPVVQWVEVEAPEDAPDSPHPVEVEAPVEAERGDVLHVLIDQSSSMRTMQAAAYEGVRELVESQPDGMGVVFSTFSSRVQIGVRRTKEEALTSIEQREANGSTALYDAIVAAVGAGDEPGQGQTLVVCTDGQDTASRHTALDARRAAESYAARGGRLLFLGANQDAVLTAQTLGVPVGRALTFSSDPEHMRSAMRSVSESVRAHRVHGTDGFTASHRSAASAPA